MRAYSEDELDLLHSIVDEFWVEFGKLVAKSLNKAPQDLEDLCLIQLQEHASVYGSNFEKYLKDKNISKKK